MMLFTLFITAFIGFVVGSVFSYWWTKPDIDNMKSAIKALNDENERVKRFSDQDKSN